MFRVLGPLEVGANPVRVLRLAAPMQRSLLGHLLLNAERTMGVDELVDRLWTDSGCPTDPRGALQLVVLRLRRALAGFGCSAHIESRPDAYRFDLRDDCLDARHFEDLLCQAGHARERGDLIAQRTLLRTALDLWRGPVLGGPPLDRRGRAEAEHLGLQRRAAAEKLALADIAVGHPEQAIPLVRAFLGEDPAGGRWRYLLMLALYRCGMRADALAAYEEARRYEADELGLEPGFELRRLQHAILRGDEVGVEPHAVAPRPCPETLPAGAPELIGRGAMSRIVRERLLAEARTGIAVCGIYGTAGVGKSALAMRIAHDLRATFPDGRLYLDLRGDQGRSLSITDALARLLLFLGFDSGAIPSCWESRAGLFRTHTSGRRIFLLLDNVASAETVRALLPGAGRSAVLVTARRGLTGVERARWFGLDVLTRDAGVALLAALAGRRRIRLARRDALRIVDYCGGLPLALRIVGAQLAARPEWPVAAAADHLADPERRLDRLSRDGLSVRASIAASYRTCTPEQRLALQRLATGQRWDGATETLNALLDAQLLRIGSDPAGTPCWQLHELVRVFALEQDG